MSWLPKLDHIPEICPVRNLANHVENHPDQSKDAPLLQTTKGEPLTKYIFCKYFQQLIRKAGIDPKKFTPHSCRRGGATYALKIGMSSRWVKTQGNWRSKAWKLYAHKSKHQIAAQINKWERRARAASLATRHNR